MTYTVTARSYTCTHACAHACAHAYAHACAHACAHALSANRTAESRVPSPYVAASLRSSGCVSRHGRYTSLIASDSPTAQLSAACLNDVVPTCEKYVSCMQPNQTNVRHMFRHSLGHVFRHVQASPTLRCSSSCALAMCLAHALI